MNSTIIIYIAFIWIITNGYPPINIKYGDRKQYYDCFTSYHANGEDASEMVSLVGEYLEEELVRYVEIVRNANEISGSIGNDKK